MVQTDGYACYENRDVRLGHTRSQRCRDLLIYFNSGHCNLSTTMCVRNAAVSVLMLIWPAHAL